MQTIPFTSTGRFEILDAIGRGSNGIVYRAFDNVLQAEVALKTLPAFRPESIAELKREFRSLLGIVHPNLIQLHELFVEEDRTFFTMQLIQGVDAVSWIREDCPPGTPLDARGEQRFDRAVRQLVEAVSVVHDHGKLHRDIKPHNVLVSPKGHLVLLDFGLSQALRPSSRYSEPEQGPAGTLAYMAPELLTGDPADRSSDWYAVGVLLAQAWTGVMPVPEYSPIISWRRALRAMQELDPPIGTIASLADPEPGKRSAIDDVREALGVLPRRQGTPPMPDASFTGRQAESRALRSAFHETREDRPVLVCVKGPSGIGKSELLRHFTSEHERTGALVFTGRCHHQESVPYKAFDGLLDQVSSFLREQPPDLRRQLIPKSLNSLVRLFPSLAGISDPATSLTGPGDGGGHEPFEIRRRAFEELREMLRRIGNQNRLILWIDDLQWADADSAVLLREIMRQPDPPPLLLLLSYRSEDAHSAEAHVPHAEGTPPRTIELAPMAAEEARSLAAKLMPEVGRDEIDRLVADSGGIPLFLDQLARHRQSRSAPAEPGNESSLEAVLRDRLRSLSDDALSLFSVVCVAGQSIERDLALRAAGLPSSARPLAHRLEAQALLRATTVAESAGIETYHDRLRELLITQLPEERLRQTHRALAQSAQALGRVDPNFMFRHYKGAAEVELAGDWAVRAAEQADRSLAFLEAARLFAEAQELLPEQRARRLELDERRATALVNAGHCSSAAPIFAAAAATRDRAASLHLQRLATEQYLVSGHIDEGMAQLRSLCSALDVPFPATTTAALLRMLTNVVRLRIGGLHFTERSAEELRPETLTAIDLCDSAGKGLVVVDPMRGLYFSFLSLFLALRAGESRRIARGLCMGGASLSPIRPMARWGREMIERVRVLGEQRCDPYLVGLAQLALGQCLVIDRNWSAVLASCDEGARILKEGSRGTTWERNVGRMAALRALEELGDIIELRRRATDLLAEAEDQGDRYSQVVARQNLANWRLAEDDPQGARQAMRQAIELWSGRGYQVQHFYAGRLEAQCDLYEGNFREAWKRAEEEWAHARRANLLHHPTVRADALLTRARIGIANLAAHGNDTKLARLISKTVRELRRMGSRDLDTHAVLLEAGMLSIAGDSQEMRRRLRALNESSELLVDRIALVVKDESRAGDRRVFKVPFSPVCPDRWMHTHFPGLAIGWHAAAHSSQSSPSNAVEPTTP